MFNFRILFFTGLTGMLWLTGAFFLFLKGYNCLWNKVNLMQFFFLTILSVILGTLKSKYVLSKSVKKIVNRIYLPIPFYRVYGAKFYSLIIAMLVIGGCMNAFSLHPFIRGFIDLSISFALIQGSFQYFKVAVVHLKRTYL